MQARLQKAARRAEHKNPGFARFISRIERAGLPLDRALSNTVADSNCELKLRALAARLLRDVAGDTYAFIPLLTEFISAGDAVIPGLRSVIHSMTYGWGRVIRPEFETLHSVLRRGTPNQRYWVVNEMAFFTGYRRVRRALIHVLDDPEEDEKVRGWAAERLHMHISQETVRACIRAAEDPSPAVRLWAVYTLGVAALGRYADKPRPLYRDVATPVLERALADDVVVPGWWSVRREAQVYLPYIHKSVEERTSLQAEIRSVIDNPDASPEDKAWAWLHDNSD